MGRLGEAVLSMRLNWAWDDATGLLAGAEWCPGPLYPRSQQCGIILTTCNGKERVMAKTSPVSDQIHTPEGMVRLWPWTEPLLGIAPVFLCCLSQGL